MKITAAFLADEANLSQDGKLNVMGVFDRIPAPDFPAVHPKMVFVFRVHAEPADSQRTFAVRVRLLDDGGHVLFDAGGEMSPGRVAPGEFVTSSHVFSLLGTTFPRPGVYRFVVSIGTLEEYETPFLLVPAAPSPTSPLN